jgi:ORF6N domain
MVLPIERIIRNIIILRGERVMLDADLAQLYGVPTKSLVQAIKRNLERFPPDFMFQLDEDEWDILRSQTGTSRWGGRRYAPYAFTEQGVAMLSSVLRSDQAVQVNIEIMRAFVHLKRTISSHADLAKKVEGLEKKYDQQFKAVFDAIRALMAPSVHNKKQPIGFKTE